MSEDMVVGIGCNPEDVEREDYPLPEQGCSVKVEVSSEQEKRNQSQ